MNCIIVDDEPLAREAVEYLVIENGKLKLSGIFGSAVAASLFLETNKVDLIFLDVQMPHINGLEFARSISKNTLVVFTTAFTEYALDSYEVDAIDYLVKPIDPDRFNKAVEKAISHYSLLISDNKDKIEDIAAEFIFVKSERRFFKINICDILFIEGLKDYVIIYTEKDKVITKMNLKNIHEKLPKQLFLRVNKSYIINANHIDSFDNNDIFIKNHTVSIGNAYRDNFFNEFITKRI